ncbi:MAG: NAD-glutamate dehydrogenase [Phycisphaeraceae bacterium]|nr:NAD-glutamate dehydrogenase [Phycisphaeraceae bacterium]
MRSPSSASSSGTAPTLGALPDPTHLVDDLVRGFRESADNLVPWFVSQMPPMYFQDTPVDDVRRHLRAIIAARTSGSPLDTTLRSEDGRILTRITPGNRPGVLAELVGALPMEPELRAAKIHSSADGQLVLDTFEFGDRTPFDPSDPAQAEKLRLFIEHAKLHIPELSEEQVARYTQGCAAEYVLTLTPYRFFKHWQLHRAVSGTDGTRVEIEAEADPSQTRITIAFSNARTRTMLERVAILLSRGRINILRAYLDQVKDPPAGAVSFLGFVLQTADGQPIDPEGELWKRVHAQLLRIKWIDFDILDLAGRHPELTLPQAEAIIGFVDLAHQVLVHTNSFLFATERIMSKAELHMALTTRIVDLFAERFNPESPMPDAEFDRRLAECRAEAESVKGADGVGTILTTFVDIVAATLRTNYWLPRRFGLALRLDPKLLVTSRRPELPYGVFFVHGRGFNGFHVRFKEIARGGLRVVRPRTAAEHARESERLYDEVYGLSFAQQLKNKDIPEGGAKCAILLEPGADVTRCVKAFVNSILDLITPDPEVTQLIVDRWGRQELIYLGPDEYITPTHIEWIVAQAKKRKYPLPNAFMSSKPGAGINHKVYGVTSEGVNVFLEVGLKARGIDPRKQPFTIKITGGPDGDVAGNMIRILNRDYGANARIIGIADGSGVGEDPAGLDHEELLRLFRSELPIAHFDKAKLSPKGRVVAVDEPEGLLLRNTLHNRLVSDAFVPGGGRPATIDERNWMEFLRPDGTPSSPLIVEGANLFLTPEARKFLAAKGVTIVKDSTANKCGVICSSYEIGACMVVDDEEFLRIKPTYVEQVLEKLRAFARAEAMLLVAEDRRHPETPLSELATTASRVINAAADAIQASMVRWSDNDRAIARNLVRAHLPAVLFEVAEERIWSQIPAPYLEWMVAKRLASSIVYREGMDFFANLDPGAIGGLARRYLRKDEENRKLVAAVREGRIPDPKRLAEILERAGTRATLLD